MSEMFPIENSDDVVFDVDYGMVYYVVYYGVHNVVYNVAYHVVHNELFVPIFKKTVFNSSLLKNT